MVQNQVLLDGNAVSNCGVELPSGLAPRWLCVPGIVGAARQGGIKESPAFKLRGHGAMHISTSLPGRPKVTTCRKNSSDGRREKKSYWGLSCEEVLDTFCDLM